MGSATVRRFALVAAMVLLVPVWCQQVGPAVERPRAVLLGIAAPTGTPAPAIRRSAPAGLSALASRAASGRVLLAAVVLGLLALVAVGPWTNVAAAGAGPSPLVRRRHAISLRAPPAA